MPRIVTSAPAAAGNTALERFAIDMKAGRLTFDELLERYCSLVYARAGNIAAAARQLQKHRATVQSRVREDLVASFREV